jgi:hypothetical protein
MSCDLEKGPFSRVFRYFWWSQTWINTSGLLVYTFWGLHSSWLMTASYSHKLIIMMPQPTRQLSECCYKQVLSRIGVYRVSILLSLFVTRSLKKNLIISSEKTWAQTTGYRKQGAENSPDSLGSSLESLLTGSEWYTLVLLRRRKKNVQVCRLSGKTSFPPSINWIKLERASGTAQTVT